MNRQFIALLCVVAAIGLLLFSDSFSPGSHREDALRHLGVSLIEVALTVSIVEWQLEKRKRREEAERTALNAIEEIDHAVWVWLGGQRKLNLREMYALLDKVSNDDMPSYFTENLIMKVGSKASHTRKLRADLTEIAKGLASGFEALEPLAGLREAVEPVKPIDIANAMKNGCRCLQEVIRSKQTRTDIDGKIEDISKQSDFALQFWRDRGVWPNDVEMEKATKRRQSKKD